MSTFIAVFLGMAVFTALMAVGVMFGRKPIAGSCGGMAAIGMESECDVCGGDKTRCDKENAKAGAASSTDMAYDAAKH